MTETRTGAGPALGSTRVPGGGRRATTRATVERALSVAGSSGRGATPGGSSPGSISVATSPEPRSTRRSTWLLVSATTAEPSSTATADGSSKRASPAGPSANPALDPASVVSRPSRGS